MGPGVTDETAQYPSRLCEELANIIIDDFVSIGTSPASGGRARALRAITEAADIFADVAQGASTSPIGSVFIGFAGLLFGVFNLFGIFGSSFWLFAYIIDVTFGRAGSTNTPTAIPSFAALGC